MQTHASRLPKSGFCHRRLPPAPEEESHHRSNPDMGSIGIFRLKDIDWEQESYPTYDDFAVLPLFALFFPSVRFFLDRFVFEVPRLVGPHSAFDVFVFCFSLFCSPNSVLRARRLLFPSPPLAKSGTAMSRCGPIGISSDGLLNVSVVSCPVTARHRSI